MAISAEKLITLHAQLSALTTYTGKDPLLTPQWEGAIILLGQLITHIKEETPFTINALIEHIINPFMKKMETQILEAKTKLTIEIICQSTETLLPLIEKRKDSGPISETDKIITNIQEKLIPSKKHSELIHDRPITTTASSRGEDPPSPIPSFAYRNARGTKLPVISTLYSLNS